MAIVSVSEAAELFELLRSRLEIPAYVTRLTLTLDMNAITEIQCTYHPRAKADGICDQCETVSYCSRKGCIPITDG